MSKASLWHLLRRLHNDQCGAVSLETILIVGAIALPILIFLIKVGWPRVKGTFVGGIDQIDSELPSAAQ